MTNRGKRPETQSRSRRFGIVFAGLLRCHAMLRISPSNLPEEAMQAVNSRGTGKEHEWALARYHLHPLRSAELNGFHTDCASTCSAVHPHLLDTGHIAILNDSLRNFMR